MNPVHVDVQIITIDLDPEDDEPPAVTYPSYKSPQMSEVSFTLKVVLYVIFDPFRTRA